MFDPESESVQLFIDVLARVAALDADEAEAPHPRYTDEQTEILRGMDEQLNQLASEVRDMAYNLLECMAEEARLDARNKSLATAIVADRQRQVALVDAYIRANARLLSHPVLQHSQDRASEPSEGETKTDVEPPVANSAE